MSADDIDNTAPFIINTASEDGDDEYDVYSLKENLIWV